MLFHFEAVKTLDIDSFISLMKNCPYSTNFKPASAHSLDNSWRFFYEQRNGVSAWQFKSCKASVIDNKVKTLEERGHRKSASTKKNDHCWLNMRNNTRAQQKRLAQALTIG